MACSCTRCSDLCLYAQSSELYLYERCSDICLYAQGTEDHVLAGTPTGVYESTDGAASWTLIKATQQFGLCHSFRNGTIGGVATVLAGCARGVANSPVAGGTWQLIPSYQNKFWGTALTIADDGATTVVAACLPGF